MGWGLLLRAGRGSVEPGRFAVLGMHLRPCLEDCQRSVASLGRASGGLAPLRRLGGGLRAQCVAAGGFCDSAALRLRWLASIGGVTIEWIRDGRSCGGNAGGGGGVMFLAVLARSGLRACRRRGYNRRKVVVAFIENLFFRREAFISFLFIYLFLFF